MTRISLVIPTRHRPGPLAACLGALASRFPDDAETILVFDGCRAPETVLAPFRERLRLRHIEVPHCGPAAARNRGLAEAGGEIVAFTDDDCRPHPGWLEALAGTVSVSPPIAAGGTTRNGLTTNPYADASQCILAMVGRHAGSRGPAERLFPSNNFAFPARALRMLGGFDERFRTAEDRDLCRRWRAAGLELRPAPRAVVDHDSRLDLRGFVRQFIAYGGGAAGYHASSSSAWRSFAGSLAFHVSLPWLAAPEVRRRGVAGGLRLLALLMVWELANLCGFATALARAALAPAAAAPLESPPPPAPDSRELQRGLPGARRAEAEVPAVSGAHRGTSTRPRVSVIVPTRNRRSQLARALVSIHAQRFRDIETIVVDDGSTDGTVEWLREAHAGVQVVAGPHAGAAAARNRGAALARGELIAFLDDDDEWRPGYLEAQVASLDAHPTADVSFTAHVERDGDGRESLPDTRPLVRASLPLIRLVTEGCMHTLSVVVCRAAAFQRLGGFDERLRIVHDLDWYARLVGDGGTIVNVPERLVDRSVPGGLVMNHRAWFEEEHRVLTRLLEADPDCSVHARMVLAYRSLFFASVGLRRRDAVFAAARLASALAISPAWSLRVAVRRLLRPRTQARQMTRALAIDEP